MEHLAKACFAKNKQNSVETQHTFSLKLKDQFRPVFLKPRTVLLAYKEKVETELNRLEKQGVIESLESSEWATPLVPVMKKDGSLRLCGDYRITANKWFEETLCQQSRKCFES